MGGFASGFQSGFGLMDRHLARKRDDKLAGERLEIERGRNERLAGYQEETLRQGAERIGIQKSDSEAAALERSRRIEGEAAALERQTGLDAEARAQREIDNRRQEEIDAQNAKLTAARIAEAEASTASTTLKNRQVAQREDFAVVVSALSGSGDISAAGDALVRLEGTALHPASAMGPEVTRLAKLAGEFSTGTRQDFSSPEFMEVVDFALEADTSIMRGVQSQRPGAGKIQDLQVTKVVPQEGGIQVQVRVQAENGEYTSWITPGRATDAQAEPAVISVDHLVDRVTGVGAMRASLESDPDFRRQVVQMMYDSNPKKFDDATQYAQRAYNDYLGNRTTEDRINGDARTLKDFEDDALRTYFGTGRLPGGESPDPGAGAGAVSWGDL